MSQFRFSQYISATVVILLVNNFMWDKKTVTRTPAVKRCEENNDIRVAIDIKAPRARGTIFTCISPDFYYVKHFLYNYVEEGYDVKVYHADRVPLNGKYLPVHWCRVHILNSFNVGLPPWIYSDADTRLNLSRVNSFLRSRQDYDGIIIANGTPRRKHEIRTNWFVLPNPDKRRTRVIVRNWASNARNAPFQDQGILNELYSECRRYRGLLCLHYEQGPLQSLHCGSHSKTRAGCMQEMIHVDETIGKYQKSAR